MKNLYAIAWFITICGIIYHLGEMSSKSMEEESIHNMEKLRILETEPVKMDTPLIKRDSYEPDPVLYNPTCEDCLSYEDCQEDWCQECQECLDKEGDY